MIHTIESSHPADLRSPLPPAERVPTLWSRHTQHREWHPPKSVAVGYKTAAYINDSRWIADCPATHCSGAELVSKDDPRFWCCSCQNMAVGGQWVQVTFPDDADRIEETLNARLLPTEKHWRPGETVSDLHAENKVHGVAA